MPPPNVVWPETYCCCDVRPCVRPCVPHTDERTDEHDTVRPETLLTRYLAEYLTHFHQTYINDTLWDGDERLTMWGQKVKGQGHFGDTVYAGCPG